VFYESFFKGSFVKLPYYFQSRRGRDRMVDGFSITYIISAYHH